MRDFWKQTERRWLCRRGKQERENNIRKFSAKLSPEEIAETLQLSIEYVLDVLKKE